MLEFDVEDELFVGDKILKFFGNCLDCGLCCKIFHYVEVTDDEIQNIAQCLKMSKKDFLKIYTKKNQQKNASTKKSLKTPCKFQKSTRCTIHKKKPFDCKTYPLIINITKCQALLTGIYLCPQATNFYQGFLDFCKNNLPDIFNRLITLEKGTSWTTLGLELTLPSEPVSTYIDWLIQKSVKKI